VRNNRALDHEDVWGSGGILLTFLTVTDGDECLVSRPNRFSSRGEAAAYLLNV